eukprot:Nk52_evm9s156 gene=Nk52_evmTU9s156
MVNSRESFLARVLQKILADRDIKKSKYADLKAACESTIEVLKKEGKGSVDSPQVEESVHNLLSPPNPEEEFVDADRYFEPFRLACASKNQIFVTLALDCIQKLIAYGHLRGTSVVEGNPGKSSVDVIIDSVCECFEGETTAEAVQIDVIKALLTAVTSNACEVHEGGLLKSIRTCYNIYLGTKHLVVKTTAEASLTQMLNLVFQRMELNAETSKVAGEVEENLKQGGEGGAYDGNVVQKVSENAAVAADIGSREPESAKVSTDAADKLEGEEETGTEVVKEANGETHEPEVNGHVEAGGPDIVNEVVEEIVDKAAGAAAGTGKESETKGEGSEAKGEGSEAKGEGSETKGESSDSKNGERKASNVSLSEFSSSKGGMQLTTSFTDKDDDGASSGETVTVVHFANIYEKDAFLVFRSLCRLSSKILDNHLDLKAHDYRSKILSLRLLLSILQNSGPFFKTSPVFQNAIKQYLCLSLSKNGVSPIVSVFELSLAIFLTLLRGFKVYLKSQIEVFCKEIFLNILETSTSSFEHKWMVMQALVQICADPQTIVDFYLNYDCDLDTDNIIERLINDMSKIAQGRQLTDLGATPQQEQKMKIKGLECLVAILNSMVEWIKDISEPTFLKQEEDDSEITGSMDNLNSVEISDSRPLEKQQIDKDDPESFELLKHKKELLEKGTALFNQKPAKGIKFLQEMNVIASSPEEVSEFLASHEKLDKEAIGEFLGEKKDYNISVMYAYVDRFNFSGMPFVEALRKFLEGFRLPGEAQKVDRLTEKFAQSYFDSNPDNNMFANADTPYVLAFSVIMLTTDLHNPGVKNKMTKAQFVSNNRGINDSRDLPKEYLEGIYDEIAASPIKMKGQEKMAKPTNEELLNERQRKKLYTKEAEYMVSTVASLLSNENKKNATFTSATRAEHVKPMFKVAWTPTLAAFSVPLKNSDDPEVIELCLSGFRYAIRVSSVFNMELERGAFVQSLAKFTHLTTNIVDMKPKNVQTIKAIISIANSEGNFLKESWYEILKCVSHLELAQLIGNGMRTNTAFMGGEARKGKPGNRRSDVGLGVPNIGKMATKEQLASAADMMGETSSQSVVVAVDRIFTSSISLNGEAILEFTKCLCQVSLEELQSPSSGRMFSLQKVVEIAYYNMGRVRFEWSRVWTVIGEHFNKVGCLPNMDLSMFAIDSLRQLSIKFLEKGELPSYHFQKEFLKPFEYIMNHNKSPVIRDMIVRCLAQMVQSKAKQIKSGWKNIFFVFSIAAADHEEGIVNLAFETTQLIFESYFGAIQDSLMDAINCLVEFACNVKFPDISMQALDLIKFCAKKLGTSPGEYAGEQNCKENEDKLWVKGWFPILFGLSRIISRCKLDVRTRALTMMFEILKSYGGTYKNQWWRDLFRVVFRILDDLKFPEQQSEKTEWMNTTCNHAIFAIVDLFTQYFDVLSPILLNDVLDRLHWCVQQDNEQLARSGTQCLQILVLSNGHVFDGATWDAICVSIKRLFDSTVPYELMAFEQGSGRGESSSSRPSSRKVSQDNVKFHSIIIKCVVQLELIQAIQNIVLHSSDADGLDATNGSPNEEGMYQYMSSQHILLLLDSLKLSHEFAKNFNANHELRTSLWRAGFMKQLPNLLKQETSSVGCMLKILFRLYGDEDCHEIWPLVEKRIIGVCEEVLDIFSTINSEKQREIWTPVVYLILNALANFNDERFGKHVIIYYKYLAECMFFELKPDVRARLRDVFLRIGSLLLSLSANQ